MHYVTFCTKHVSFYIRFFGRDIGLLQSYITYVPKAPFNKAGGKSDKSRYVWEVKNGTEISDILYGWPLKTYFYGDFKKRKGY